MADWETDALTGRPVVVVGDRQHRPNRPDTGCPFCPGGIESPGPYDVRAIANRWPALPGGRSEVVLYSDRHEASLATLGVDQVARVVTLWTARGAELGRRPDVACVLVFENRGADAGATIDHPHGQIYAFDAVPPAVAAELEGPCAICAEQPGDRLIARAPGWRAWVPARSAWPYEMLLAPDDHVGDLGMIDPVALAAMLVDTLGRLDRMFGEPAPYMLWVHQRPTDGRGWPASHVHVHIAPVWRAPGVIRHVAAGEVGSGVWFNPVAAADAADHLRQA